MACNIEIKAYSVDFSSQFRLAEVLCGKPEDQFIQEDTYFQAGSGRLKLREFADGSAELIQYQRADSTAATQSSYLMASVDDPETMKAALTAALGIRGVVSKNRTLFLHGQTRLHLDRVDRLGEFIEIEVVLRSKQQSTEGEKIAAQLMTAMQIAPDQLIEFSYIDLLEKVEESSRK